MDRLDALRLFLAILDAGSLAGGGRRLGHAPPVVTRTLAALEERAGTRLLARNTRSLRPTEAGLRLAERARHLVAEYDAAIEEAAGDAAAPRGRLRIAAPLVFGRLHVAPVVALFLAAQRDVTVELVLSDRNAALLEEGLDVAVRIGALPDAALVARAVGQVVMQLAASPGYLAAHGAPAHPRDLAPHALLHFAAPGREAAEWSFALPGGRSLTVPIAPRFTVNAAEPAIDAAIAGRGIVRALSYQLAEGLAGGWLVRVLPGFEPAPRPVSLLFPASRLMPARVRAFLDFAAPRLSALPALRGGASGAPPPTRSARGRRRTP